MPIDQPSTRRHTARGALLGAAVGDALGAPFEGSRAVSQMLVENWMTSARTMRYTDDTAMTVVLTRSDTRWGCWRRGCANSAGTSRQFGAAIGVGTSDSEVETLAISGLCIRASLCASLSRPSAAVRGRPRPSENVHRRWIALSAGP